MTKKKPVPPYLVATNQQIDLSYFDRLPDVASPEPVQKRKTGIMARMGDAALALGQGAVGSFKAISDVAGADNAVSRGLGSVSDFLGEQKSEESRATLQASQQRIRDAEQTGDWKEEAKAYLGMIWDQPAEMLAQGVGSFATLGLGKAAQALKLTQAAKAAGMTKEAFLATRAGQEAAQAAAEVGFKANIGVSAAQGLGGVKGSQYEQTYQNAIAQGYTPEQAQAMATEAQSYGGAGAVQQLVGAGLGGLAAATGPIERAIAGRVRMSDAPQSVLGSIGKGFATEGATEGAQGAQERLAGNEAAIRAGVLDPSQRFAGVVGQGLQEGVIGGVIGGVAGPLERAPAGPMTRAAGAGAPVAPPPAGPIDFENVPIHKPEGMQTAEPATGGMDFEADPRFKQAPIYPNGAAPARQQYGTPEAASIALGEQGLVGSHEVRQPQPGVFEIRPKAAPRVRMVQPGIYELPPSPKSPVSPAAQAVSPPSPVSPVSPELAQQEPAEGPAPVIPVQMPSEELRRAGVDPLTGELPPPPPFAPVPPDANEPGMVKGPDGTLRATFDTEQEARAHIAAGRKQDRSIAISHQPVQLPDGRWTLALPGEPGHKGKKIKVRLDGAGIPGQDATLLDPNTAKPWRSKQAAGKFAKTVDGYEVLQNPDGGWILQQKVKGAAPEAQPGMSVSQEAPKDAAPTPIEFSAEDRSRIEGMFAEGKNGAQVAKALGRAEPHADVVRAVGALRKELGIPFASDAEAFKAWREARKTVDAAAHEAAPSPQNDLTEPTDGQKEAGNYKKGHATISGLDLSIENPQGSVRRGKDRDGKEWENTLQHHYGYIKGTVGNDKDHVDTFVKPGTAQDYAGPVFVVDQVHPDTGKFDEHKALIGFDTMEEAKAAYRSNYAPDWKGMKAISAMPFAEFKTWVKDGPKTKPLVEAEAEPKEVEKATAVSQPKTETEPAPSIGGAQASPAEAPTDAQTKWDAATQDERFETLKAAGWGFGKAGPSASAKQTAGKAWDKLTDSQRERIGAVAQPTQILTSEDTLKQLAQALEAAGMKPMADADGAMGRVFELDVGNVSVVRAEVVSSMGQPQQVKVSAMVPTMPTQTETVMTPEAAVSLVRDYAQKVEQFRQDAAKKMAAGRVETTPKAIEVKAPSGVSLTKKMPNVVVRDVRSMNGEKLGDIIEPHDGTEQSMLDALERTSARMAEEFDNASNAASRIGATDAEGNPAWAISPNGLHIKPIGTDEARYIWGDLSAGERMARAAKAAHAGGGGDGAPAVAKAPEPQARRGQFNVSGRNAKVTEHAERGRFSVSIQATTGDFDSLGTFSMSDDGVVSKVAARANWAMADVRDAAEQFAAGYRVKAEQPRHAASDKAVPPEMEDMDPEMRAYEQGLTAKTRAQDKAKVAEAAKPAVSANTVFTEDAAQRARQRLLSKLKGSQLNSGIDPEVIQDGITLAGYHIEKGARTFAAYAKAMLADLGDIAKPHLKSWYMGVKYHPAAAAWTDMDSASTVEAADIEAMGDVAQPEEAAQTPAVEENTNDDRRTDQVQSPPALDQVAAPEGGATEGRGDAGAGAARSSAGDTAGNGDLEAAGRPGPRGRGDRAADVRAVAPRAGGRNGPAGAGRRGAARKGLPDDAPRQLELTELPADIPAANFQIGADVRLGQGSEGEKFKDNLAAIRVIKAMERDQRRATPDEQRVLARYVGWGGLANAFADDKGEFKPDWRARGEELAGLLTPAELKAARRSTRNAHYTSETVVTTMWDAVKRLGYKGGLALESSVGTGNFLGLMPSGLATKFVAVEYDSLTARIAAALYPQATVLHSGLQKVALPDGEFDLNIGNPPFGDESLRFQFKPGLNGLSIHNQFFLAGMDSLKPGGIQALVVSRYLMDAKDSAARRQLATKAKLLGAIRLPDTAFKENARTEVVTDILFFQRHDADTEAQMRLAMLENGTPAKKGASLEEVAARKERAAMIPAWVSTVEMPDPLGGEPMTVNPYFRANPGMVMGTMERSGSMRYKNDITVRLDKGADLKGMLAKAIEGLPKDVMTEDGTQQAAERFKSMSDALRTALMGLEPGSLVLEDGKLRQVVERETPKGEFELTRRDLTPQSPWSETISMDKDGRWFRMEAAVDADGKPAKVMKGGKPTNRNVYERKVFASEADIPEAMRLGQASFDRLLEMVKLRDLLKRQLTLEAEDAPKADMDENRAKLAGAYDAFVAKHGFANDPRNAKLIEAMPDGALVLALETAYRPEITPAKAKKMGEAERPAQADKAPILTERVVLPYEPPGQAGTPTDALLISLAETGGVDLDRIGGLLGMTPEAAAEALQAGDSPMIFKDPETDTWQHRDAYLSGQVRRKLNAAKSAGLDANVKALESVQPEQWGAENVTAILGSSWVPPDVYEQFLNHLTGGNGKVRYSKLTNSFDVSISGSKPQAADWASEGASVEWLTSSIMNSRAIKVMTPPDSEGRSSVDQEKTALAQIKAKSIQVEFSDWVFADGERRRRLVEVFNEKFNTRVLRQFDGAHLTLPGKVPDAIVKLRRHQKNAIWRGISQRFNLFDHVVGAGKTFTAIATVMERRRMGLSRKPAMVVPNHMVQQFTADIYRLYPGAKVLAAGKKDFERSRRRRLFAKIATGDWDVVVIPHSSFGYIGISQETEERYLEEELRIAKAAIDEAWEQAKEDGKADGWRKPFNVKEAERLATKIEERMDALKKADRDRLLTFEQLGIDDLTVDEAHEFKNLFYSSRLSDVRGLNDKAGSQKAFDLYNKVRVLTESPTGKVTFMTGTPISNSAVEMFTMMRYLAAKDLKELNLEHFDAWRAQFVDIGTKFEPTESGRLKEVNRLGRTWSNMRSLMDLYYSFTDAVTIDDIKKAFAEDNKGREFPVPKVAGGDRRSVVVKPTPMQDTLLKDVLAGFDSLDGIQDVNERNATRLRLMDRARKVSLDARAVDPTLETTEPDGKLQRVAEEVTRIYNKHSKDKGTQLIFLDRSVPKAKGDDVKIKEYDAVVAARDKALANDDEDGYRKAIEKLEAFDTNEIAELRAAMSGGWNAYDQIKKNLIAQGIPEKEIRFVQEAATDAAKQALFDAVNDGEVRVLIGSTPRMGAGTNVQKRLVGLHHVDVTWKPSDIEQREGRIIRQGNSLLDKYGPDFEVEILAYATERTADAKMWDLNATKLKTINGIRKYGGEFTMDFEDAESVSMAELAALASGDPKLLERVKLDSEIDRLELEQSAHRRKMMGFKDRIDSAERTLRTTPKAIETQTKAASVARQGLDAMEKATEGRSIEVEGKTYTKRFEAAKAARDEVARQKNGDEDAKFAIKIGGKRRTSESGIEDAIDEAFGDPTPFAFDAGTQTFARRTDAARYIADKATESGGVSRSIAVGNLAGFVVELDVSKARYGDGFDVDLTAIDEDGRTIAQGSGNSANSMVSTATAKGALEKVEAGIRRAANYSDRYDQQKIIDAKQELPKLLEKSGEKFPKADLLAEKLARREQLVSELSADKPAAPPETPAMSRGAGAGMQPEAVREAVAKLTKGWSNAPEVVVVSSMTDAAIPAAVRQENQRQLSQGATGEPEGFFYGGKAYLVASQIGSEQDARRVLFHETLGHYGLRGMFGEDLKGILGQIIAARPREVRAKVMEYGLNWNSKADRLIAAEEVLAVMAQENPELGFVRRALAAIRTWLRGVGMRLGLSDAEIIRDFILPARQFVTGRRAGAGGGVVFSRAEVANVFDDEVLRAAQSDSKKLGGLVGHAIETDAQGVIPGRPREFDRRMERGDFTEDDVRQAFSATIDVIRRKHGDTLTLWRADAPEERRNPATRTVFMADRSVAMKYASNGREALAYTVNINELLGVYARQSGYYEAIVKIPDGGLRKAGVNESPMFSRSTQRAAETLKAFDVKQAAKATGNTLAHYRGMAMQALGRRQIVELWGKDLPQLVSYSEHVQRMEAEKNDTAAEADAIADAWGKLKDETQLAELMHDATVAQIDPAKPYQLVDSRADYDRLRKAWDALSPEAQGIYIKARDSYAAHYQAVKDSITERVMRTMAAGDKRRVLLERMERDFFKSTKGVYFPLARFGKYVVVVRGKDGAAVAVSRAETINEAQEARARLVAEFPAAKGYTVGKILKDKEFNAAKDGPGKGFMDDLFEVLEGSNASNELIDSVGQLYLSSLPDLSWAKHGIHRKGTPGFSQDARRAFAQNVFHGARYLARLRWADRLQDDLVGMQEHVQANTETPEFDSIKAQQVVDEMVKRHDILMNPNSNPVSTALTSIGFVFHLGLSPASAMVNLLQTATTAYPVMGAKWGFDKSAAALMTASREAVKGGNDISKGLSGDELAAYNEAVKTGVIDVTMAHDLAGIATGEDAKVSWAMRPVMKAASFMFHHAEKFNRQVTFMAAYRLARAAGADHLKGYTQAVDATYQGHFDYGSANRPRFMAGNVTKVLLLFKQYAQNMIYLLARQAHQSLKGLTPQDRAEARKALAGVLVTHAAVAGFLGLPLVGTLLSVASWLGSDDDEPWDAEAALRNSLADTFGTQAADIMAKGLSRATPWDISGRVGLNTLILPDMQEGLEGKDLWKATLEAAAGPVFAIGGGILEGLKLFGEGEYMRGAEAMLPAALRGPAKALRYGSEGAQDKTGVSIVDEVSAAGVAGQALGLSPSEVRLATEAKSKVLSADKALMKRRSTLLNMAAKAAMAQDMEGLAEIREQIKGWNQKNPTRAINSQHIRASVAARRRRIANAENGVSLPQNRRGVIEAGAFGQQQAE